MKARFYSTKEKGQKGHEKKIIGNHRHAGVSAPC